MPEGNGSDPRRDTTPARWRVLGHPAGILAYQARCIVEDHGWTEAVVEDRYKVMLGRSGCSGTVSTAGSASRTPPRC